MTIWEFNFSPWMWKVRLPFWTAAQGPCRKIETRITEYGELVKQVLGNWKGKRKCQIDRVRKRTGGQREVVELLESSSSRWQSQISKEGHWSPGGAQRTLEPRAQPLREGRCCSAELVSLEEWGGEFRWGTLEFRGWEEKTGSNCHCRVRLTGRESQTRKEQSLVSFPDFVSL